MRVMTVQREIELKLAVSPKDAERLRLSGPLSKEPSSRERRVSIYFDTPEHELRKAGLTLGVRRCGNEILQTIKTLENGAGLFDRNEWETPLRAMRPQVRALRQDGLERLLFNGLGSKLDPIARVCVDRSNWTIAGPLARINISLETGGLSAGNARTDVAELELELKQGPRKALFNLCEKLGEHATLRVDLLTKAELAEALADGRLDKPAKAERPKLRPGMTIAEGLRLIAFSCLRHFRLNEDVLRGQRTPEALHQLHVATRRLHTSLILFRCVARGKKCRSFVRDLHRFGAMLGRARDLDLAVNLFSEARGVECLKHSCEAAYEEIAEVLASPRIPKLMLSIVRWLTIGKWQKRPIANAPLASFLAWELDESWVRISERGKRLGKMGARERHRFRIAIKQFRYALEFSRGMHCGMKNQRNAFRGTLQELQEELGLLNDRRIARQWLAIEGSRAEAELCDRGIESELVRRAESDFQKLLAVGPYWRGKPA